MYKESAISTDEWDRVATIYQDPQLKMLLSENGWSETCYNYEMGLLHRDLDQDLASLILSIVMRLDHSLTGILSFDLADYWDEQRDRGEDLENETVVRELLDGFNKSPEKIVLRRMSDIAGMIKRVAVETEVENILPKALLKGELDLADFRVESMHWNLDSFPKVLCWLQKLMDPDHWFNHYIWIDDEDYPFGLPQVYRHDVEGFGQAFHSRLWVMKRGVMSTQEKRDMWNWLERQGLNEKPWLTDIERHGFMADSMAEVISRLSPNGGLLVDLFGGAGLVAERLPGWDRLVVDIGDVSLAKAQAKGLAVYQADLDCEKLNLDKPADVMAALYGVHWTNPNLFQHKLMEWREVLAPGGKFVINPYGRDTDYYKQAFKQAGYVKVTQYPFLFRRQQANPWWKTREIDEVIIVAQRPD